MSNKPLRVGFIGAGTNTRERHIPGFQEINGVDLRVVCNRSEESSRAVADACGIPRIADTWREVIDDPEVDAVCIGTWPYMHAEMSIAALEAGKHVLCEARMAMNAEEARHMLACSQKYPGLVAQVVPSPFTLNFDATIRHWLEEKRLGRLLEVRVTHTGAALADPDASLGWRQHFEYSGINTLTLGIFHESVQRWLAEEPDWVFADAAIFTEYRLDPETNRPHHVRIPESLDVLGRYRDGARLVYHFSGVESGQPVMEFRLNGDKGALRLDVIEQKLFFAEGGTATESALSIPEKQRRGWRVEADFVDCIRQEAPVLLTSFPDGVRYMEFTQRVFDSLQSGERR